MSAVKKVKISAGVATGAKQHQPVRQQYRVIDDATRKRRSRQFLEQLERDNFHDDPHANLVMHKKAPKFDDKAIKPNTTHQVSHTPAGKRHIHRTRMLTWAALLEEDAKSDPPNYGSVSAPSPDDVVTPDGRVLLNVPARKFCSVCGFKAPYTCVVCGSRFCSAPCQSTHRDTRCMKWTS